MRACVCRARRNPPAAAGSRRQGDQLGRQVRPRLVEPLPAGTAGRARAGGASAGRRRPAALRHCRRRPDHAHRSRDVVHARALASDDVDDRGGAAAAAGDASPSS